MTNKPCCIDIYAVLRNNIGLWIILGAIIVILAMIVHAFAHSQYSAWCCNGTEESGDCRPVPCGQIIENGDGSYSWNHAYPVDTHRH